MGILQSVSQYVFDRTVAFESAFNSATDQLKKGTYTVDLFFKDSSKLWIEGAEDLSRLFPALPLDTVPTTFKQVGPSATFFTEFVNPAFFPSKASLVDGGLIPLNGGKATAAPIHINVQTDGTLQIDMQNLKGQASGELYQYVVFYVDTATKVHPVVVLLIRVT